MKTYHVHIEADPNGFLRFDQGIQCKDIGTAYAEYIKQVNFSIDKGWRDRLSISLIRTDESNNKKALLISSPIRTDMAYAIHWTDANGETHHLAFCSVGAMWLAMSEKYELNPVALVIKP